MVNKQNGKGLWMELGMVWTAFFFAVALPIVGWALFSLAAGFIVYLSMLTTDHAGLETAKMRDAEKASAMYSHTKDLVIMEPIEKAKERWFEMRERGTIGALSVLSRDGLRLSGYAWPSGGVPRTGSPSGRAVVLVHGFMDSAAGLGYLAEEYHRRGWAVYAIDLRAHGESEGSKRTMGARESEDLSIWVNAIAAREPGSRLLIHGISMGGATALLYGGGKKTHPSVMGIVSDSSYADYSIAMDRLMRDVVRYGFVSRSIVLGASVACFCCTGRSFTRMRPIKAASRITVPLLLFHGDRDALVPIGSVRKLLHVGAKPGNECVVVPEAPHIGPYFYAKELYMKKIEDFSRRYA